MNIIEASIDEYGHLKNVKYEFVLGQLTVVYGLNEAGKSTLFHFMETILFGFSRKKHDVEHFMPDNASQYGGHCIIQLDRTSYIKITRHHKRHKGAPLVTKLKKHNDAYDVVEEQLLHQDEFEKLYMSGLTREMFRDLCALTLDELQATNMKDDEQLNQHLYHATWESSKMIAKLEDESSKVIEKLYRPRGTKQEINQLMSQFKEAKATLLAMEDELDTYVTIQNEIQSLQQAELKCKELLIQQSDTLELLQKVEQDYSLYEQYEAIKYEQSKLIAQRQTNSALLSELQQYFKIKVDKQSLIDELLQRKQQLQAEMTRYYVDEALLEQQRKLVEQYPFIEALLDDIDLRRAEIEKLAHYIKNKSYMDNVLIDESVIEEQLWTSHQHEQLKSFEADEKEIKQQLSLLNSQREQYEQKQSELRNQLKWCTSKINELEEEKHSLTYTFVPQQLDELIKAEASYEESYKRMSVSEQSLSMSTTLPYRTRQKQKEKKRGVTASLFVLPIIALVVSTILLVSQFNVTNLLIVLLIICGVSFFMFQQFKSTRNSSNLHISNSAIGEKEELFAALYRLIVLPEAKQVVEWTKEQDYELRKMIQHYKTILKALEQVQSDKAMAEKQLHDLSYQIEQHHKQFIQFENRDKQHAENWSQFILQTKLPKHASIQSVKAFVYQIDELKDNIASYKQLKMKMVQDEERLNEYYESVKELLALHTEHDVQRLASIYMQLKHDYDEHLEAFKHIQQLQQQLSHMTQQLDLLQGPLLQREADIKQQYEQEAYDEETWKIWVEVEAEWERYNTELFKLEQQRRQFVSPEQLVKLNEYYEHHAYTALLEQANQLQLEVEQLNQQITSTAEGRGTLQERLTNLTSTYERQQLQLLYNSLEEQIKQKLKDYAKYALVEYVVKQTRTQFEAEHQPALMKKASQYINQLTNGKYIKLVLNADTKSFQLATSHMSLLPIERLSRGTAELVYFCLRVALLTTHKALSEAPLIVDDPFVNFDKIRQQQMLTFIHELAQTRQVILLTCHDHIVELTKQKGQVHLLHL